MNIKLIAIDLDGTTMKSNDTLSYGNKSAIESAISSGIYVVPTTGRALNGLPKELMELGIKYAVTSNGSSVIDIEKNKLIYSNCLPNNICKKIVTEMNQYNLYMDLYIQGKGYAEKRFLDNLNSQNIPHERKILIQKTRTPVNNLIEFIDTINDNTIEKLNINILNDKYYKLIWDSLIQDNSIKITTSLKNLIEVGASTASKADGLIHLCKYLNISSENVMALGDGHNDIEMLKFAKYSVAMENGSDELKKIALFTTLSNDNDGLAYALKKFLK